MSTATTTTTHQKSKYNYEPSFEAAVIFAMLYTVVFVTSAFQCLRYRAWVWIIMVVAAGMESAGYIIRSISTKHVDSKNLYVLQFCLIVLAPVLMAAACYVIFGRIVYHVVPSVSRTTKLLWIPPRYITPIFVVCDIIALLLQLYGAVKITSVTVNTVNPDSVLSKGKKVAEIGVAVQLVCFGLFAVIAVRFNFTSRRFKEDFLRRIATAAAQERGVEMTAIGEGRKGDKYYPIRISND
ncbi:hypothetical protein B7494_g1394 [Chlorociboria aeruginascens]|nr:hypothetical protein B7494_g1394 [Chlorociboria aeruginascens]